MLENPVEDYILHGTNMKANRSFSARNLTESNFTLFFPKLVKAAEPGNMRF